MKKIIISLLCTVFILGLGRVGSVEAVMENISLGGDIRIRGVYHKNITDFKDETRNDNDKDIDSVQYFRHRTRIWLKGTLEGGFTAYVRATAEPRWGLGNDAAYSKDEHILFDNSYVEAKDFLGSPLTLKIGRQDIMYGEGFLIMDGTPYDGSRTFYFDAIKLSSVFADTNIDLFTAKINENQKTEIDDHDLYGLYVTNKSLVGHKIEAYLFQRSQLETDIPKQTTMAIGARFTGDIIENLAYAVELAKESGKYDDDADVDRDALGGYAHLTHSMPEVSWKPSIRVGVYYTSGDDPDTADENEGWDGLFSDWPKFGELATYTNYDGFDATVDNDEGTWTNFQIYEFMTKFQPLPDLTGTLRYLYMLANEKNGPGDGDVRGNYPQLRIEYKFTEQVSGTLTGEYFDPGDYYADNSDEALFGQAELMIKF